MDSASACVFFAQGTPCYYKVFEAVGKPLCFGQVFGHGCVPSFMGSIDMVNHQLRVGEDLNVPYSQFQGQLETRQEGVVLGLIVGSLKYEA